MYDYAIERRLATINPATMVATKFIGKAVKRKRHLNPREMREFLEVTYRSNIRRQFKLALHIILLTLVRKSMLLMATWDEFDFEASEWNIPKEHVKAKKVRNSNSVPTDLNLPELSTMTTKKTVPAKLALAKSEYTLPAAFQQTGLRSVKRVADNEIGSLRTTPAGRRVALTFGAVDGKRWTNIYIDEIMTVIQRRELRIWSDRVNPRQSIRLRKTTSPCQKVSCASRCKERAAWWRLWPASSRIAFIAPGNEGPALAPLPLRVLEVSSQHTETFALWGRRQLV
jgi:hypothetical protein